MTEQLKSESAACPKCGKMPAEFKQKGGPLRWSCAHCGASGPVQCSTTPKTNAPTIHKHWSNR